jgi:hypothetical protein
MNYDYYLPDSVLEELVRRFNVAALTGDFLQKFSAGSADVAKQVYGSYGVSLMKNAVELGKTQKDRTAEVIDSTAQKTGVVFPSVFQRCLETAILATRANDKWGIDESSVGKFSHSFKSCSIYNSLKEKNGDAAKDTPCRWCCIDGLSTLCSLLGINAEVRMNAAMAKDGKCEFVVSKK